MRVLFGTLLVLMIALLAASPPAITNAMVNSDQGNTAAIMAYADVRQSADGWVETTAMANTVQSIDMTMVNMQTANTQEAALVAPELVASGSRYVSLFGEDLSANTMISNDRTGTEGGGALCACTRSAQTFC